MAFIDGKVRNPYITTLDNTRQWVESIGRKNNLVKPNVLLRFATDTNHIRNEIRTAYDAPYQVAGAQSQSVVNNGLPTQRIPGLLNWSVTEAYDQMTSTAQFECLNCLQVSRISATLTDPNPLTGTSDVGITNSSYFSNQIIGTWAQDSFFAVERVTGPGGRDSNGNKNIQFVNDSFGYAFREENVVYRLYENQYFQVDSATLFPDPAIQTDDDNDVVYDTSWAQHINGAGSYYVLVGGEVMRVVALDRGTGIFQVPPGGRGLNGQIAPHFPGETVTLLGYGPPSGDFAGAGYLTVDDFHPELAILRPGTCITSYEGYGDITGPLSHWFNPNQNYQFTGYWFVDTVEPTLGSDGTPRVTVSLKGPGAMFEEQKINLDVIQRMKNQFGQWTVDGKTLFSAAGATRNIPGDWVDYNSWDPTDQYSYPLTINIEYAQHWAFFDHMQQTQNGLTCQICHQELSDYLKTHKAENPRDRPVGRHVYKESIRVLKESAGPIKTYIRLMATMAAAAWDHPAFGTELSQKFTKIPNQLWDNIRNIFTGMCYNGIIDANLVTSDPTFDWTQPGYDDTKVISNRTDLACPFSSSYDNQPFAQPMQDLAEINGATFWVDREGYPVFKPYGWNLRSEAAGCRHLNFNSQPDTSGPRFPSNPHQQPGYNGQWIMTYGASIDTYSVQVQPDDIVTQMWVTGSTAFDIENASNSITITAGGTGYDNNGQYILYSPIAGHKQGLSLTAGVQQVDTMTLDNQYFGLQWDTSPASWGLVEDLDGQDIQLNAKPPLYDGSPTVNSDTKGVSAALKRIQTTINFFLIRGYMNPIVIGSTTYFTLDPNGKWSDQVKGALQGMHSVLAAGVPGATYSGNTFSYKGYSVDATAYGRASYHACKDYFDLNEYFLKTDIWWYVNNGKTWEEYVAAQVGIPIPFTKGNTPKARDSTKSNSQVLYVIDDKGLQREIVNWYKQFAQAIMNQGNIKVNKTVDSAIVRSITSNLADPRVQPGDTIYCEVPGHLSATSPNGDVTAPFNNGIYVQQINRQLDLESGTYTATYSGTRAQGVWGNGVTAVVNPMYDVLTE